MTHMLQRLDGPLSRTCRAVPQNRLDALSVGVLCELVSGATDLRGRAAPRAEQPAKQVAGGPEEMIAHLRSPGPHARGCWAVDLLLGKS